MIEDRVNGMKKDGWKRIAGVGRPRKGVEEGTIG